MSYWWNLQSNFDRKSSATVRSFDLFNFSSRHLSLFLVVKADKNIVDRGSCLIGILLATLYARVSSGNINSILIAPNHTLVASLLAQLTAIYRQQATRVSWSLGKICDEICTNFSKTVYSSLSLAAGWRGTLQVRMLVDEIEPGAITNSLSIMHYRNVNSEAILYRFDVNRK